ncbi:matrixin family metalloprotease [Chloroflexota bacterium]
MKKVIITLLIIAILVLTLPTAILAAEPLKKPITPPQLKEITFVHYAKPDKPPKPDKPGKPDEPEPPAPDNSAYELLGISLPDTATFYVNSSGAPVESVNEIIQSFETWDIETGAELFSYAGQTSIYGLNDDGQNTVSWVRVAPRSTIALTRLWYNPATNEIVEFDIVFNAFLKWDVDPDDEGPIKLSKAFDVENIATHEVGHVVGLGDLYEEQYRELTMYGYGQTVETMKISLEEGDVEGAQYLYGEPMP